MITRALAYQEDEAQRAPCKARERWIGLHEDVDDLKIVRKLLRQRMDLLAALRQRTVVNWVGSRIIPDFFEHRFSASKLLKHGPVILVQGLTEGCAALFKDFFRSPRPGFYP